MVTTDGDGRERILEAAIRGFAEAGYTGTTTAAIARAAGVTQPLVHHHFKSKDGLWRAAMEQVFADVPGLVPSDPALPADQVLGDAIERFVQLAATRPALTRIIAREGTAPSPRLTYLIDRFLRAPFERIIRVLRHGQTAGMIQPQFRPELLLFFFLGAGNHLFDVSALARESVGLDVTAPRTRADFISLVQQVLRSGVFKTQEASR
jgi:TetR/AcrR family transcriptional regulator